MQTNRKQNESNREDFEQKVRVIQSNQVIQRKQKKRRWATRDPPLANSTNGAARCSLTFKKI